MKYVKLGKTGLKVSRIGLGCMSLGFSPNRWILDEQRSIPILRRAVELGITLYDTANMYGKGASEEFLGKFLWELLPRENVVLASKVFFPMREDSNGGGLSRKSIAYEIDCSLRRLRTDYIDLYQIHRWDPETPIEETLGVLTDLVRCGKVRYIGASSMFSWQFCKALYLSKLYGWSSFVSMQPHYNLLNREAERELLPLCEDQGIGVLPYSPLARGRLARPWQERKGTDRSKVDTVGSNLYDGCEDADRVVVEQVGLIAEARGVSRAQIATAWLLHKPIVTAPLIGATRVSQLEETVAAESLHLEESEIRQLEVHYAPHKWLF